MDIGEVKLFIFRNLDNALIKMGQLVSLIMSFTLYTSKGYIAIFYAQFPSIQQSITPIISV